MHQTPEQIARTAVDEDVDGVGLSTLSGAHLTLFPQVVEALAAHGAADIVVFGGGIIPDEDLEPLREAGIAAVFTPGTSLEEIEQWVADNLTADRDAAE